MAYHFKRRETVPRNVKRIAREELAQAVQRMHRRPGAGNEDSIHDVRTSIKKLRSLMRLVRPGLGRAYAKQEFALRDTGRKLSQIRDAEAFVVVFDRLKGKLPARVYQSVHRALLKYKAQVEKETSLASLMPKLGGGLAKVRDSVSRWPLHDDGFTALESGLVRAYREGRKAMKHAANHSDRESWHDWRKRVKDHWYHVRLLENLWSDVLRGYEDSLKNLQDALGDFITLDLLREHIEAAPDGYGRTQDVARVVELIEEERQDLGKRALEIGERVYAEKPSILLTEMKRLWKVWRK